MISSINKHEMKKLKMVYVKSRTLEHLIKFKGTMLHSKTFLGRNGLRCYRERYMNTDEGAKVSTFTAFLATPNIFKFKV